MISLCVYFITFCVCVCGGGGGDACMKVIQESEIKRSKQGRVQILE
jgi:hypothetical protein